MRKSTVNKFQTAFERLTEKQQDEIRELAAECNKAAAAHKAAVAAWQKSEMQQCRAFKRYEKRAKALGLPVPNSDDWPAPITPLREQREMLAARGGLSPCANCGPFGECETCPDEPRRTK